MRKNYKDKSILGLALLVIPLHCFAYGTTTIDMVLQNLLDYITSAPARIFALLAILGVGFTTLHLGKMPKERALAVVVGIGVIFGGATILQVLGF